MASDAGANSNAKITIFKMVFEKAGEANPGIKKIVLLQSQVHLNRCR